MIGGTAYLRNFPVQLFRAFEQQSDALLREYVLLTYGQQDQPYTADDVRRAADGRATIADALAAHPGGDVIVTIGDSLPGDLTVMQGVLNHARDLARAGRLLAYPSLPEIVALRTWITSEVTGQAAGAAPKPWPAALTVDEEGGSLPLADWPELAQLPIDLAWIAGDDQNRIVAASPPALALLAWNRSELIGRRIPTVIPPRLRASHVAAFTLNVVSGRQGRLGEPLFVPALTRDGREVPVVLTLTRHRASGGRQVYLARLEPVAAGGDLSEPTP